MRRILSSGILLFVFIPLQPRDALAVRPPERRPDAGGVLSQLGIAAFGGSGQTSIQAAAADASGNIYIAGTATSPDFPVKNAAQPVFGAARILRTTDLGVTWTRVGSPPDATVTAVAPDPVPHTGPP